MLSDKVKLGDDVYYYPIVAAPRTVRIVDLRLTSAQDLYGAVVIDQEVIDNPKPGFESNMVLFDNLELLVEQVEEDIEYLLQIAKTLRKAYWEQREARVKEVINNEQEEAVTV